MLFATFFNSFITIPFDQNNEISLKPNVWSGTTSEILIAAHLLGLLATTTETAFGFVSSTWSSHPSTLQA